MDPVRQLGMYPEGGQEAVQRAMNQRFADIKFTSEQIEAEQPELTRDTSTRTSSFTNKSCRRNLQQEMRLSIVKSLT